MDNREFSELASKKLAPLRHDGFERASFKYFLESGTVNASFLQLIKELCDDYHEKILNGETLESGKSVCPLCQGNDVFDTELKIYKCRSCDARWTN